VESTLIETERFSQKLNRCCHKDNDDSEDKSSTQILSNFISSELPKNSENIRTLVSVDKDTESANINDKTISNCSDKRVTSSDENNFCSGANDMTVQNGSSHKTATNESIEKNVLNGFDQKTAAVSATTKTPNVFQHFDTQSNFTDEDKEATQS
jgi:hypothetical protein